MVHPRSQGVKKLENLICILRVKQAAEIRNLSIMVMCLIAAFIVCWGPAQVIELLKGFLTYYYNYTLYIIWYIMETIHLCNIIIFGLIY